MPSVSVVIPTYNRSDSLRDTLQSLRKQDVPANFFEVIVVDNNSKDDTSATVEEAAALGPFKVHYLFESRQGISYARNSGIQKSQSPVIAFTDDDVLISPSWIQSLWNCFTETSAAAVGGRIERLWQCQRPAWYQEEIGGALISQNLGGVRIRWQWAQRHMVGANMAFRREVFSKWGYFREDLGRRGESLVGGEDRDMFQRLFRAGVSLYYEPQAIVYHKVEASRLSKDYMRRWFWNIGETLGHGLERRWHYAFTFAPVWVWKKLFESVTRFAFFLFQRKSSESDRFCSEMWVRHYAAILKESFLHWLPLRFGKSGCAFANR